MAKGDAGPSVTFQPAATKRASEIIYEQVREMIVKGKLKPGDRLPNERAMMEMFQRSRPTVREALRMLERSGYIRTSAGSNGAVVTEPGGNNNMQMTMQGCAAGREYQPCRYARVPHYQRGGSRDMGV